MGCVVWEPPGLWEGDGWEKQVRPTAVVTMQSKLSGGAGVLGDVPKR